MYSFLFMFYSNYCYSLHYLQDTVTTGLKMLTPTYHNLFDAPVMADIVGTLAMTWHLQKLEGWGYNVALTA